MTATTLYTSTVSDYWTIAPDWGAAEAMEGPGGRIGIAEQIRRALRLDSSKLTDEDRGGEIELERGWSC